MADWPGRALTRRIPGHLLVAASAWMSRAVSAVSGLLTIRILMNSLGGERYAVCAVLGGLQGWYMLADLGIGISLQNHISERRARGESSEAYIAAAALISLLLLLMFGGGLLLISPWLGPVILKGFAFLGKEEQVRDFLVVGVLSVCVGIGSAAYKIWYAEQKGYLANIMPALASLTSLGLIMLLARSTHVDRLFWSLVATIAPMALFPTLAFSWQALRSLKAIPAMDRHVVRPLLTRAGKFWFFGIMAAGVLQIDYVIMSQFLTPHDIVRYNLGNKIFSLIFFVYNAVILALWPVCAEAIAQNSWDKIKGIIKKYISIGFALVVVATLALLQFMPQVMTMLSPREQVEIPLTLILLLGGYYLVRVWTDTFAMVLQSMSYLRPFMLLVPLQAALSIGLQWLFIRQVGVSGAVLGLIGSFLLTVSWVLPVIMYKKARSGEKAVL